MDIFWSQSMSWVSVEESGWPSFELAAGSSLTVIVLHGRSPPSRSHLLVALAWRSRADSTRSHPETGTMGCGISF